MSYIEGQKLGKELGLLETSEDFKRGLFNKPATTPWTLFWKELAITAITIIIIL